MFSHVCIGTNDLQRSVNFYTAVLGVLGVTQKVPDVTATGQNRIYFMGKDNFLLITEPIDNKPATVSNGLTIGYQCNSAEQVKQFHDVAVANGGTSVEDPPGVRPSGHFLAYVRDPDGHKLCALYTLPKEN